MKFKQNPKIPKITTYPKIPKIPKILKSPGIMRHFDAKGEGQIDYNSFCKTVFDPDYSTETIQPPELNIDAEKLGTYADTAAQKTVDRAETEKIRRAVQMIELNCFCR